MTDDLPRTSASAAAIDDAGIDRLADLLERRALPFKGLSLEALDGFQSALAVGPETVPDADWQPVVGGGRSPRWENDAEAADVDALLAGHRRLCEQRVRHGDDRLPDRLMPLVWLPEDPDADHPDTLDIGRDWAEGFLRAVALREAAWEAWMEAHTWIDEVVALIDRLASGEVLDEDPAEPPSTLDYRERLDLVLSLPGMLTDLHAQRIETLTPRVQRQRADVPERNAPCPCGSGRKYKKCCAVASPA